MEQVGAMLLSSTSCACVRLTLILEREMPGCGGQLVADPGSRVPEIQPKGHGMEDRYCSYLRQPIIIGNCSFGTKGC